MADEMSDEEWEAQRERYRAGRRGIPMAPAVARELNAPSQRPRPTARQSSGAPGGLATFFRNLAIGFPNPELVCPHCQTRGHVHTKLRRVKVGIGGGKATAAILTGGVSLLAVGLSRKEWVTACECLRCGSNWRF